MSIETHDGAMAASRRGLDLLSRGAAEEAITLFRQSLAMEPFDPAVHLDLGSALRSAGRQQEAADAFQKALDLRPDWPMALYNLGIARLDCGDVHGALAAFQKTIALQPDWSLGYGGLGVALWETGTWEPAKGFLEKALALDPSLHMARHYLGLAHAVGGDIDAVISTYRDGIRHDPSPCPECRALLGTWLLAVGDYAEGWREYEWRWAAGGVAPGLAGLSCPVWDGTPLEGRSILLWDEQGLGDMLQLIRFAPLVQERGGTVWVRCRPSLQRLFAACPGVSGVVPFQEDPGSFDAQLPIASLPRVLGIALDDLPAAPIPYLMPPPGLLGEGDDPFGPRRGGELRVGIVWGVENGHPYWQGRSCPLPLFRCLEGIPGVELYSLQFGPRAAELRQPGAPRVADLSAVLGDFARTAAVVEHLDLVVTVDTSMAHLAGGLGKPVWTLIPYDADWRWLRGREDSPWYPTMRLFRQRERGKWAPVLERVAAALREIRGAAGAIS